MTDRQKEILDRIERMRGPARAKADGLRLLCSCGFPWINAFFLERAESDIHDIEELQKLVEKEFSDTDEKKAHVFGVYKLPSREYAATIYADDMKGASEEFFASLDMTDDHFIKINDMGNLAFVAPYTCEKQTGSFMIKRLD